MTIIVAGKIMITPGFRAAFIDKSRPSILEARKTEGCEDFSVSPDPVDPHRINIFEKWLSRSALEAFRQSGPESDLAALIESIDVNEYELNS